MTNSTDTLSNPLTVSISEISARDLPLVGGKGANLGEMASAGFPVPPGFCITTHAFDRFINGCPQEVEIFDALSQVNPDDLDSIRNLGQWIRDALTNAPFPNDVSSALLSAWQELGSGFSYAVRSSATAEDLPDASFAGQQDTFLNVTGSEQLVDSVRLCWTSLFTDRAILYRIRNQFSHRQVSLAVVIQRMVLPEVSGILFTADPVTGRRHIASIDASFGLGEALVAGLVSADLYLVDTRANQVIEQRISEKQIAIRPSAGGGTVRETVTPEQGRLPSLSRSQALQIAAMGQRLEAHYGIPQDIEWAIANEELFMLQTRPITSLFPIPLEALNMAQKTGELQLMFSFGAVQGMLDPMTPLGQDAVRGAFAGAAQLFGEPNMTVESQPVIWPAAERLFVNFTAVARHPIGRALAGSIFGMVEPSVAQALEKLRNDPRLRAGPRWFKIRTFRRIFGFFLPIFWHLIGAMRRPNTARIRFQSFLDQAMADFELQSSHAVTLSERVALLDDVLHRGFSSFLPQFGPVMMGGMSSLNLLAKLTGHVADQGHDFLLFTRGLPHNVTTEMDLALWTAARQVKQDPASLNAFSSVEAADLATRYLHGELPQTAQAAVAEFMGKYGMRGVGEIDLGRPRWREEPTHIMQVLQSYIQIDDESKSPDAVFRRGAEEVEAALPPLLEALRQTRGGRIKARLAVFAVRRMRALAGVRESPKFSIVRLFGMVRQALLAAGSELVENNTFRQEDDLFYLHLFEMKELAAGHQKEWQRLIDHRRTVYEREKRRSQVPRMLLSDGHAFYEGVTAVAPSADGVLSGSPVSPGLVEGHVRVVFEPHKVQLKPGEILVCPGTDPAWTPLFLAAGGLVTEVGGLMTHGSVVAREYGIPAVVGVHQATTLLKTGQLIRLDGSSGIIQMLDNGLAAERSEAEEK